MNFGFSGEMIFLFFLALILFGPKKLPEIGRQIGRFMMEFRRASYEFRSQIESEMYAAESQSKPQILPPVRAAQGSLASRIFNPPSPEQMQAAEAQVAEAKAAETQAAATQVAETQAAEAQAAPAAETAAAAETGPAPSPAPKVAPDA